VIFLFVFFYLSFDFRHFPQGTHANWPLDIPMPSSGGGSRIYKPYLLAPALLENTRWFLSFLPVTAFSALGAFRIARNSNLAPASRLLLIGAIVLALGNAFTLAAVVLAVLLLLDVIEPERFKTDLFMPLVWPILAVFTFWLIFGLAHGGDYGPLGVLLSGGQVDKLVAAIFDKIPENNTMLLNLLNLFMVLFYYPTGLAGILYVWLKVYPLFILASGSLIGLNLYAFISKSNKRIQGHRFLLAVLILNAAMVGMLAIGKGTRYTFFLYPVFLLLAIISLQHLLSKFLRSRSAISAATLCVYSLIFIAGEDFNLNHLRNIDSKEINFRRDYDRRFSGHYISRRDYRGVAEYLNREASADDIVISAFHPVLYYTDKVDYMFFGYQVDEFAAYTACAGKRDVWTNRPLLYKTEHLFDLVNKSQKSIYIIVNVKDPRGDETEVIERYRDAVSYTAQDGIIGVINIKKNLPVKKVVEHAGFHSSDQ
jgi:hypothetical protein